MVNLIEGLQEAMTNSRELLDAYRDIGSAGAFATMMIKRDINAAEKAIADDDCVGMLTSLRTLRENK